jgi:hypothetical protein
MRGLLRFLGVQLRPGNYRSRPSFFSSFFPFPRSRGTGPYSIRFISFHLIIFPLQLFVLLRYVNCLSAEGTDGGGKTWADTRCNWAEHLNRNAGSGFHGFRMSGVILCGVCYSMDIIQCHLRSLPTYYTTTTYTYCLIYTSWKYMSVCVSRLKCGTLYCFMYIACLTTNTITHMSHHQTIATLALAMSNHSHNQTVEARHAVAFESGDAVE